MVHYTKEQIEAAKGDHYICWWPGAPAQKVTLHSVTGTGYVKVWVDTGKGTSREIVRLNGTASRLFMAGEYRNRPDTKEGGS